VGLKNEALFERSVSQSWHWSEACQFVRWFSDGERRYGKQLWQRASLYLSCKDYPRRRHRKVWREGLEVAMKIKGSQACPRVVWVKFEHPWTALVQSLRFMPITWKLKTVRFVAAVVPIAVGKICMPKLLQDCNERSPVVD
jgi:hypothetical protein